MSLAVSGGWLQKLGTNNRWQKRWFHVRDGTLVYATKVGGDGNASKRFDMDDLAATPLDGDVLRQMAAPAPPSGFTFVFRLSEQSGAKMRRGSADAARAKATKSQSLAHTSASETISVDAQIGATGLAPDTSSESDTPG